MPAKEIKQGGIGHAQFILDKPGKIQDVYHMESNTLGQGTYGTVCKGKHKVTKAVRAIKTIPKATKTKNIERFKREIAIMKMMDHPGIVKLYETFEDQRNIYLSMELCEGGELFDKIIASGRFTEVEAAHVMQQVLRAIFYMHMNRICHRDLKPENFLLLTKEPILNNVLKIIDFGLSHDFKPGEFMSTRAGTPFYVAPEVLTSRYTERCDLWSAGVIMYVILCGYPPFTGKKDSEVLSKVKQGYLHFPHKDWRNVSDDAKDLIRMLVKTNPQERLSAEQALQHAWIAQKAPKAASVTLEESLVHRLRAFRAQNKFKKAVLHVIAGQLSSEQIRGLRNIYMSLDANGDGLLTLSELHGGLQQAGLEVGGPDLQELMDSIDADGSGVIDYTEFLAATLEHRQYVQEDVCRNAFSVFDLNSDGKISREELRRVLHSGNDESLARLTESKSMELVWQEVDSNNDGSIDFEEFLAMMRGTGGSL
jgi:calcium-dependent protein kinase